jgi:phosphoglycolate phosphatase-like HAD superfamily hydrolase
LNGENQTFVFTLNDTLYNASLQKSQARLAAVEAMIENGLTVDVETAYSSLEQVVKKSGGDAPNHFNLLLAELGFKDDHRIVAAGVVAYREVSKAALRPYPYVHSTLISLREKHCRLILLTAGDPVKEWQKLIQLGLQHLFHEVHVTRHPSIDTEVISELVNRKVVDAKSSFVSGKSDEVDEAVNAGLRAFLFLPKTLGAKNSPPQTQGFRILNRMSDLLKAQNG